MACGDRLLLNDPNAAANASHAIQSMLLNRFPFPPYSEDIFTKVIQGVLPLFLVSTPTIAWSVRFSRITCCSFTFILNHILYALVMSNCCQTLLKVHTTQRESHPQSTPWTKPPSQICFQSYAVSPMCSNSVTAMACFWYVVLTTHFRIPMPGDCAAVHGHCHHQERRGGEGIAPYRDVKNDGHLCVHPMVIHRVLERWIVTVNT